jgi:hypothetical protein
MNGAVLAFLEKLTATVLVVVLLSLGWISLAAWRPELAEWPSQSVQVGLITALFTAALLLVSAVALLHTRH